MAGSLAHHLFIPTMQNGTLLAAVDLGSKQLPEIGLYEHGRIQRVDYLKETVRQGNGLTVKHNPSLEAMQRGWDCLARFAERFLPISPRAGARWPPRRCASAQPRCFPHWAVSWATPSMRISGP